MKKRVLFLCTHNSARSQMAEGLLRWLTKGDVEVHSAGTEETHVKLEAVQAMQDLGVDISDQFSKTLDGFVQQRFDYVITVCDHANETCPFFPHAEHRVHWSIEDPSAVTSSPDARLRAFCETRDELQQRIENELLPVL